jgi:hypothetical protein
MTKELDEWLKNMSQDTLELNQDLVVGRITQLTEDDMAKRNKFGAVKTTVDGHEFDSRKESRRYIVLKEMQERGEISRLTLQPKFILQEKFVTPVGEKIRAITYTADFLYTVTDEFGISRDIIEDVKGGKATQTDVFKLKWKMLKYVYRDKPSYEFKIVD